MMKMPSSYISFSNRELIVQRKRNMEATGDESESGESSSESLGGSETPLIAHWVSYSTPADILKRMALSLVPPLQPSRALVQSRLDVAGAIFVVTLLIGFLTYASSKTAPFRYHAVEAITIIGFYMIISPSVVYFLGRLFTGGRYNVSFVQILILLGYSLTGHFLTLLASFVFYTYEDPAPPLTQVARVSGDGGDDVVLGTVLSSVDSAATLPAAGSIARDHDVGGGGVEEGGALDSERTESIGSGDSVFLFFLPFVAGSATLRVGLLLLSPIQSPHGRMILGNIFCLSHLLLLIFLHATFVHPTFQYGANG